jgi:hypothetical protein
MIVSPGMAMAAFLLSEGRYHSSPGIVSPDRGLVNDPYRDPRRPGPLTVALKRGCIRGRGGDD